MTYFSSRPKHTFSDPERFGYPPEHDQRIDNGGILFHVCSSCKASAQDGEAISHKPGCKQEGHS